MSNYIRRAEQAGLGWPLPPDIDERTLGRLLFPSAGSQGHQGFAELDYVSIYQELKITPGHQVLAVARIPGASSRGWLQLCPVLPSLPCLATGPKTFHAPTT